MADRHISSQVEFPIVQTVLSCHERSVVPDPWILCFEAFGGILRVDQQPAHSMNAETKTLGALHLSAFLASWGMNRGGSYLAKKAFTVHEPIIELISASDLRNIRGCDYKTAHDKVAEIARLIKEIKEKYEDAIILGDRRISNTLSSKVLLGTLGIVMGFDRFVQSGIQAHHRTVFPCVKNMRLANRLRTIFETASNMGEFEKARKQLSERGKDYTPIKIIDMYFWEVGYQIAPPSVKRG